MSLFKRFRSASTGQYVTPADAAASPDTTVSERRYLEPYEKATAYRAALTEIANRMVHPDDENAQGMRTIARHALGWPD